MCWRPRRRDRVIAEHNGSGPGPERHAANNQVMTGMTMTQQPSGWSSCRRRSRTVAAPGSRQPVHDPAPGETSAQSDEHDIVP
jgi:hypothetical protein